MTGLHAPHRTVKHSIQFVDPDTGAHTNTIVKVARRQGLHRAVQQGQGLRVPPRTVHVHGEVQGAKRFTVPAIPSPRSQHRMEHVRCAVFLCSPEVIFASPVSG